MSTINFEKVDATFAHLADDEGGQRHLAEFADALNRLRKAMPELNDYEAQYVTSALVHQRTGVQSNIDSTAATRTVHGFVIKSAVT